MLENISVTENKDGTITANAEVSADVFEQERTPAVQRLGRDMAVPGFRKGHVPENIIAEKLGEGRVLEEMARRTLNRAVPELFKTQNIDALGRPEIRITKLAAKNPLGFTLTTGVMPTFSLPDYRHIVSALPKQKDEAGAVTDNEVEKSIEGMLTEYRQVAKNNKDITVPENAASLTDEFVKQLGDFTDVADFRIKIRTYLAERKKLAARDRKRSTIIEALVEKMDVTLPSALIDAELERMLGRFKGDVQRTGASFEDYLKNIGKSEEDFRKEWRPDAEKNAKTQLLLTEIAKRENIKADASRLDAEVKHVLSHNKEADERMLRIYIETLLTNEKVFEFLESLGESEDKKPKTES